MNELQFTRDGRNKGKRYMKYKANERGDDKLKKDYPVINTVFENNLTLCQNYIRMNTTIRAYYVFDGKNILANDGPLREQAPHTDYRKFPEN